MSDVRRGDRSVNPKERPREGWEAWARAEASRRIKQHRSDASDEEIDRVVEETLARVVAGTWRAGGEGFTVVNDGAPAPVRARVDIDARLLPERERALAAGYLAAREGLSLDDARARYLASLPREVLPRVVRRWHTVTRGPWWDGRRPDAGDLAILAMLSEWDPGLKAVCEGWRAVTLAVRGELRRASAEPSLAVGGASPRARDAHAPGAPASGASSRGRRR